MAIGAYYFALGNLSRYFSDRTVSRNPSSKTKELGSSHVVKIHLPPSVANAAIRTGACLGFPKHCENAALTLRFFAQVVVFILTVVISTVFSPAGNAISAVNSPIRVTLLDVELIQRFGLAASRASAHIHAIPPFLEKLS